MIDEMERCTFQSKGLTLKRNSLFIINHHIPSNDVYSSPTKKTENITEETQKTFYYCLHLLNT